MKLRLVSAPCSGGSLVRVAVWSVGIVVGLIVLGGLVVLIEDWRGDRAWARCQRELAAQGEKLDLKEFVPAPVPPDQNFAATPLFAGLDFRLGSGGGRIAWPDDYDRAESYFALPSEATRPRQAPRGCTDLEGWQRVFRRLHNGNPDQPLPVTAPPDAPARQPAALEVLEALKVYDAALDELRAAARRPASRFPIPYFEQAPFEWEWPHLGAVKRIVRVLRLRMAANLAADRPEPALEDVRLMLRLTDAVKDEPMMISQLMRLACFAITAQAIREGLAEGQWTEPHLKELQDRLTAYDFVADLQRAVRADRAWVVALFGALLSGAGPQQPANQTEGATCQALLAGGYLPAGWLRAEQANYCREVQRLLLSEEEVRRRRINPRRIDPFRAELEPSERARIELLWHRVGAWIELLRHRLLAKELLAGVAIHYPRFAHAQTSADQARTACALERYRLAKGQYPESLAALVPEWIEAVPNDVISGEPMRYRRTEEGRFILWSVGWDGRDDHGKAFKGLAGPDWGWEPVAK